MKIMKYFLVTITMLVVLSLTALWAAPLGVGEFITKYFILFIVFYIGIFLFLALTSRCKPKEAISLAICSTPFLDYMYFSGYLFSIKYNDPLSLISTYILSYIIYAIFLVLSYKLNGNSKEPTIAKTIVHISFLIARILALILIIHSGILL